MSAYSPSRGLAARAMRLLGKLVAGRARGRLCILTYHRLLAAPDPLLSGEPDVATFEWQMKLLADCFNVLPLPEALAALDAGTLPPRAVCITFDDGYRSVYELALPVLARYGLPATVFVTTGFIGEGSMWNDRIVETVRQIDSDTLDLRESGLGLYPTATIGERQQAVQAVTEEAKYLPPQQRQALVDRLDRLAGKYRSGQMLTAPMIRALAAQGIEIGAHTVSHPILTRLDEASARHEIAESKRQLEALLGRRVRFFAYPNGKRDIDFDDRHAAMAREAGYQAAFTTAVGAASAADDRFHLPRARPWDNSRFFFTLRLLRWLAA